MNFSKEINKLVDTEVMEKIPRYSDKIKSHEKITYLKMIISELPEDHIRIIYWKWAASLFPIILIPKSFIILRVFQVLLVVICACLIPQVPYIY